MRISPRHLLVGMLATSSASQAVASPTVGDTTTQNSPNATDPQNDTTGGLQEVVVTAERREENVQKAPLTIQVLGGDSVRQSGVTSVVDISRLTTGLEIGVGGSSTQIYIRGVGDFAFNPLANPGVAFNVDGVYIGRPDGLGGNLYDLARVEVLKGPQGTLYGRNANGGSINVITNEARLGQFGGDVNIEYGNFNLVHVDGAVNVPIDDTAALRVAINTVHRSGYLSDGTNDDVQQSGRLKFKWQPNDDVTLRLNADYAHIGGNNGGYTYLPRRQGASPWEGVGSPAAIAYRDSIPPFGPLLDPTVPDSRQNTKLWSIGGQLDWRLPFATLTVLPAFRDSDIYSLGYLGFVYEEPNKARQSSLEMRLGDSTPRLTWVIGDYVFHESGTGAINIFESEVVQNTTINYNPKTSAFAVFGQATYEVLDGLRLIGGLRYTYEQRSLLGNYLDNRPAPLGPGTGTVIEAFDDKANFNGVTYKVGVEYDLATQNLLYLTVSTGFKAGGLNETIPPEAVYRPEKLRSIEFGSRNRFLNNHLQLNFGLYDWKYQDLQDQRVTFDPVPSINLLTFNVGDATIRGATIDIVFKPWEHDSVSASAEYADSFYNSFNVQLPTAVFFPGSVGCPTHIAGADTVADCSNFQVARVPRFTGTLSYDHSFALADDATVDLSASAKLTTRRWIATDFIPAESAAGYATFDLNLAYSARDNRYTVGAFVRNIGDRAYYTGGFEQPFVAGLFAANIAPPRTFGIRGSFNY
jgi:iron complex outermembrane receptor protein